MSVVVSFRFFFRLSFCFETGFQACVEQGTWIPGVFLVGVPHLPKCQVPVLRAYRTYRVPGTATEVVPTSLNCRLPVLRLYLTTSVEQTPPV